MDVKYPRHMGDSPLETKQDPDHPMATAGCQHGSCLADIAPIFANTAALAVVVIGAALRIDLCHQGGLDLGVQH
eukprot:CAMPEP_0202065132 /NCGR_PEP_ID=MMETSP0963-20130614/50825_1 /ASSEMBLY_ACC=CAM_ASM_000494 /TAXON_ID=4773 /ORGANISM="Schizochytrium aggregatum, Strain ATCC28209" /LENGTH=73 /DNA_ID=CAMNT_0048631699 /DNA_START=58 /DNA_END=277 /DNA_ORIENTATION=+